jgi:hypothetical protein
MDKQIIMARGETARLSKDFGIAYSTVWRALTYRINTPYAKLIRKEALRRGGVVVAVPTRNVESEAEEDTL